MSIIRTGILWTTVLLGLAWQVAGHGAMVCVVCCVCLCVCVCV